MTASDRVVLDDPEGEGGLAAVLAGLVSGNLERNPGLASHLDAARGTVQIVAKDGAESTAATLVFDGSTLRVRPGGTAAPDVAVVSSYGGIVGLAAVPMAGLLPKAWTKPGRDLLKSMANRSLSVRGLATSPLLVLRLLALVSAV